MAELSTTLGELYTDIEIRDISSQIPIPYSPPPKITSNPLQLYVTYPHAFCENGTCRLTQLEKQLPRIQSLGMNAIHILPPFKSPMIDNGFDVSDYYAIREEIGGNDAFEKFLMQASQLDMQVFVDFVLNHVSDQHEWFQKAIAGDQYYQQFFHTLPDRPPHIKTFEENGATYARYSINGAPHDLRVIFPDQVGEIPHWVEHNGVWYFHTFYPQQIDLDWSNPHVFAEMSKVLMYWAEKGCSFRLDAVSHIGKNWNDGMQKSTDNAHTLVQALRHILALTNSKSVFLVEVNEPAEKTITYSGAETHKESDLMYHFELTEALWETLLLTNTERLWQLIDTFGQLPQWSKWVTFLRNHDALTIRYCAQEIREQLYALLEPNGLAFREGNAISGRTASFLENDSKKIITAHLLLASLPGYPALMYGDELGKMNDMDYMYEETEKKRTLGIAAQDDTRDIGRGLITESDLNTPEAQKIQKALANIFTTRAKFSDLAAARPEHLLPDQKKLFAASYRLEQGELRIFINLGEENITIQTAVTNPMLTIHDVELSEGNLSLGAYSGVWVLTNATTS